MCDERLPVGGAYNYRTPHHSLMLEAGPGSERKWLERTPAMAAGLTDHVLSVEEVLRYRVPRLAYIAPKRRGRPPNRQGPSIARS